MSKQRQQHMTSHSYFYFRVSFRKILLLMVLVMGFFLIDWGSKWWAVHQRQLHRTNIWLIGHFIGLNFTSPNFYNQGVFYGLRLPLAVIVTISLISICFCTGVFFCLPKPASVLATLYLAGIWGNLINRSWSTPGVVDFVVFKWWFQDARQLNIADLYIMTATIGVLTLAVLHTYRSIRRTK